MNSFTPRGGDPPFHVPMTNAASAPFPPTKIRSTKASGGPKPKPAPVERWADLASDALELLPEGVVVIEEDGRVCGMNGAARRLLGERGGLSLGPRGLTSRCRDTTRELRRAIQAAARGSETGQTLYVPRIDRPPLLVRIFSLESGRGHRAAVFVREAPMPAPPSAEQIVDRFGVSPMESEVAHRLAGDSSVASIARDLGIAVDTVRGHLKGLFKKTGAHRQAAVVALLLSPPCSFED